MKKFFSLMLLLATILTFTACGGDDDDEPTDYSSQLVGSWIAEQSTTNENLNITVTIESIWDFKSNGYCYWTLQSTMDGKVLQSSYHTYQYSYDGKELSLTADGETQKISAVLKANTLTLVTEEGNTLTHYKRNDL